MLLKGSDQRGIWTYYKDVKEEYIIAYKVVVKEKKKGKVYGSLQRLDYPATCGMVRK